MRGIFTEGHNLASGELAGLGLSMFDEAEVEQNIELQLEKQMGICPKSILRDIQHESPLGFKPDQAIIERMLRFCKQDIARLPNRSMSADQARTRDELLIKQKFLSDMLFELAPPPPPPPPPAAAAAATAPIQQQARRISPPPPSPIKQQQQNVELTCPICKVQFHGPQRATTKQYNIHLNACLKEGSDDEDVEQVEVDGDDEDTPASSVAVMVKDDYEPFTYQHRINVYNKKLARWLKVYNLEQNAQEAEKAFKSSEDEDDEDEEESEEEEEQVEEPVCQIAPGLNCPLRLFTRLLPHQKEALPWLYRHFENETGCILGDEMGLGKSCQTIALLASLKVSGKLPNPVLLVAPLTTVSQWVEEIHMWYAPLKVIVIHDSFGVGRTAQAGKMCKQAFSSSNTQQHADVILITYQGLSNKESALVNLQWSMVVLDEAHLIKNPDAKITITCKRLNSVHRLALTGSPIQNRLHELWSLFDFVAPRKLGTLPTFEYCFVEPIRVGGLQGATNVQIMAAFEQAKALRQSVTPHMLRRTKKQVATWLPEKTERVLFCKLTPVQRAMYLDYIESDYVRGLTRNSSREDEDTNHFRSTTSFTSRKSGATTGRAWRAITTLRKICNHPDLAETSVNFTQEDDLVLRDFDYEKSCKMVVLNKILCEWRAQGDKVLVFCQGTKMLSVLESFAEERGWPTMRMDGKTQAKQRQGLIRRFNTGPASNTFLFLLTTRVGGIGINLTGANKVIIYDPDWNPSTDSQARERAWRLGQTRPVTVYRLICTGTIEEKIYHRQIFKQFLTNKVLDNPSQRRFFKESDLRELFTLGDDGGGQTLTDTAHSFYQDKKQKDEEEEDSSAHVTADNAILKKLFHSEDAFQEAFKQDIAELASKSQSESVLQAQFAKDAARNARKRYFSEEQRAMERNKLAVNVPTYTGANGAPPAAQSLLQMLKKGSNPAAAAAATAANDGGGEDSGDMSVEAKHLRVFKRIQVLLKSKSDLQASSDELLKLGKTMMANDPNGAAIFRELLRTVATFDDKTNKWKLKAKYQ